MINYENLRKTKYKRLFLYFCKLKYQISMYYSITHEIFSTNIIGSQKIQEYVNLLLKRQIVNLLTKLLQFYWEQICHKHLLAPNNFDQYNIVNSIIFNLKMRNRNTINDQWKPATQRNLVNSVQRKTMTNPMLGQTQPRTISQQQLNQKMGKTINQALNRLPNHGKRTSISNVIQPTSSNLLSTIASLMNLIDRNFTKANLEIQSIQPLISFWGYQTVNKSVFQPVGAPHTWPVCLNLMEFLAEISMFIFDYRIAMDDYRLDMEQIDFILQAYANDNCQQFQAYLDRLKVNLTKEQQELTYKIQSSQLTLRNIKNSQRSLVQMQTQQSVLLQKLQRESQNVIQIDQKNNSILSQIQKTDDHIEQLQLTKDSLMKKISMLEQQITNQQLSLQEATKIELDIKEYHSRIKDIQNEAQIRKKQYEGEKNKLVQNFYKVIDDLNQIKNSMKKYQSQMQKRNIQIPLPQADHVAFTEAIHTEDMNVFNQAVSKMIQSEKIKTMLIAQQSLADLLQHQAKSLNNQLADAQLRKNLIEQQNKQGFGELQKLQIYYDQTQLQIQTLTNKRNKNLQKIQATKQRTNQITLRNEQYLKKEIQLTQETKQRKQHMIEGIKMFKKYQVDCDNSVKAMQQKQAEIKKKVQQILFRIHSGFGHLNNQLQSFL